MSTLKLNPHFMILNYATTSPTKRSFGEAGRGERVVKELICLVIREEQVLLGFKLLRPSALRVCM